MKIGIRTYFYSHTSESTTMKNLGSAWSKLGHEVWYINSPRPNILSAKSNTIKDIDKYMVVEEVPPEGLDVLWELYDFFNARVFITKSAKLLTGAFCWGLSPLPRGHIKYVKSVRKPFIVQGEKSYNEAREILDGNGRVYLQKTGVDRKIFNRKVTPHPDFYDKNAFKFLWVGNASVASGPDIVIRAYYMAFSTRNDCMLTMVDPSGKIKHLALNIANTMPKFMRKPPIRFVEGGIDHNEMASIYRAHDFLVMPIRFHCVCRPITEAMSCGLPIMTTRWGGPTDYLDERDALWIKHVFVNAIDRSLELEKTYKPNIDGISFCSMFQPNGGWQWAEPITVHLAQLMKKAYLGGVDRAVMSTRIAEKSKRFSWEKEAKKLEKIFLENMP